MKSSRLRSDHRLLRRAAVSVGLQAAVAAAIVIVAVALVAYALDSREQSARAKDTVRSAALGADDVSDPPSGTALFQEARGTLTHSPNLPADLRGFTISGEQLGWHTFEAGGRKYQVYVAREQKGRQFAAVMSLEPRANDLRRLRDALLLAAALGVAGAALIGALIGWRATRPLGRALALQRRFVADASHELRTPLTVLHTRAQLVDRTASSFDDHTLARQARDLVNDTRALGDVIEDLLLAAQLEHQPERSQSVDLEDVAAEVVHAFTDHAATSGVSVTLEAEAGPFLMKGIRSALRRSVSALVDNALAHEHPGGRVTVELRRTRRAIVLTVSDDGSGLDPDTADQLTRRFVRGAPQAGGGRRFGIGLALVQEVVQTHDGTIGIDGVPEGGARFTLTFPTEHLPRRDPDRGAGGDVGGRR